jgi:hypothetical protein
MRVPPANVPWSRFLLTAEALHVPHRRNSHPINIIQPGLPGRDIIAGGIPRMPALKRRVW